MAIGAIDRAVFTDIANVIRAQNGGTDTYLPSGMAAAVLTLDGDREGMPLQAAGTPGTGVISDSVLSAIADAIRAQNGSSETCRPGEMAPAILALAWDVGVKIRAALLSDGTLEFNYRDGRSSDVAGVSIVRAWEVDPEGYASAGARPWDGDKLLVTRAVFDADFVQAGITNTNYFFHGFENMLEISGLEALSGVTTMNQMLVSCSSLETIWSTTDELVVTGGSLMFNGCSRLVGGQGYVPSQTDGHAKLTLGVNGVLTDPAANTRDWCRCFLFDDGELVLTSALERATFAADMGVYTCVNLNYLLCGHQVLVSVTGWGNLSGTREMRHSLNSCRALAELDLAGFDPSALENLTYTFATCSALTTI